jgi:hypothetical protein
MYYALLTAKLINALVMPRYAAATFCHIARHFIYVVTLLHRVLRLRVEQVSDIDLRRFDITSDDIASLPFILVTCPSLMNERANAMQAQNIAMLLYRFTSNIS